MHVISLLTSIMAASLAAGSLAAPSPVAEPVVLKRTLGAGQLLPIVQTLNLQVSVIAKDINQSLAGVTFRSPAATKAAAGQKVIKQIATLNTVLSQGLANVTHQARAPAALLARQGSPGTNETRDLINALGALVTLIDSTILQVVATLGLTQLIPPIMSALNILSQFFLSISAVVIDFLPFLGPIGTFLTGIGNLLNGIGALVPGT